MCMNKNFYTIILLLFLSFNVSAEQWEWLLEKEVQAAVKLTSNAKNLMKYCKPCQGKPIELEVKKINTLKMRDGSYRFVVNSVPQDLAYLYYFTEGRWKNIAITLGLKTHGLDEFITKSTDNPQ